jgi:hypothetical protein
MWKGTASAVPKKTAPLTPRKAAEIELDGVFVGATPEESPACCGETHYQNLEEGFKDYQRTLQVLGGGTQRLATELEPQ